MNPSTPCERALVDVLHVIQRELWCLKTKSNEADVAVATACIVGQLANLEQALHMYGWPKRVAEMPEKPAKKEEPCPVGAGAGEPISDELPDGVVNVPTTLARTVTGLGYMPSDAIEGTA